MSTETLTVALVGAACFALFWLWIHPFLRWERRLLWLSFFLHAIASGALYYITVHVYGYGDMLGYGARGQQIARALSNNLADGLAGIASMVLGEGGAGAFAAIGGAATTRMTAFAGLLMHVTGGSFAGAMLLMATLASLAMVSLYRSLKLHLDHRFHLRALVGVMFTPAVLIWSSGLLKEAAAIFALGFAASGLARWMRFRRWPRLTQAFIWAAVLYGFKPYVAVALVAASLVWVIVALPEIQRKQFWAAVALLGAVTVIAYGSNVQQYAQSWAARFAEQQELAVEYSGGSTVPEGIAPSRSVVGQLTNLPVGMLNVWTRPWPSDVRSPMMALSSLQMLVLAGLVVSALTRSRWRGVIGRMRAMPVLVFCLTFGFVESVAVGLGSLNLGSIDRYRAPALLLVVPALLMLQGSIPLESEGLASPHRKFTGSPGGPEGARVIRQAPHGLTATRSATGAGTPLGSSACE